MAEEVNNSENAQTQAAAEQQAPVFQMHRCYFKDASLEMPNAPAIFFQAPEEQPTVDVQFEVLPAKLPPENLYEVAVRGTITVKDKDRTIFLVEGKQAGVFELSGFDEPTLQYLLNVNCPTIVYPYLRAQLTDLVSRTTMPPVQLPEVNFEALYQQRLAQAQAQQQPAAAA